MHESSDIDVCNTSYWTCPACNCIMVVDSEALQQESDASPKNIGTEFHSKAIEAKKFPRCGECNR